MKKTIGIVFLSLLAFIFVACGKTTSYSGDVEVPAAQQTLELELDEPFNLTPTLNPSNSSVRFGYTSSDPSIVSVSNYGAVLANKLGDAEITVTGKSSDGKIEYKPFVVKVSVVPVVHLIESSKTLFAPGEDLETDPAETYQISATSNPAGATFTYSSSNTEIATVSATGLVTTVAAGTANITVTSSKGGSKIFEVRVVNVNTDDPVVTFNLTLNAPVPQPYINVYLVGSFQGWTPADPDYIMTKIDDTHYTITLEGLERGKEIQFKFTLGTSKSKGTWGFGEKVDGSPTENRKERINGGATTYSFTAFDWESTNLPDPGKQFIPGATEITWEVTLAAPLASGQWIAIVGSFGGDDGVANWKPMNEGMRLTVNPNDEKVYTITLSTSEMEGGKTLSYKFIIGDASTTATDTWANGILYELGANADASNIDLFLDGGKYEVKVAVPVLEGEKAAVDVSEPEAVGDTQATYTWTVTLEEELAEGQWLVIVGAFGVDGDDTYWSILNQDMRLTVNPNNSLEYSITLNLEAMKAGVNLQYKFAIGNTTTTGWDNLDHELGDGTGAGNISVMLLAGEQTVEIEVPALTTNKIGVTIKGIEIIPATCTFIVTLDEALADGKDIVIAGSFGGDYDWQADKADMKLVATANPLEYSITVDLESLVVGKTIEFKLVVGGSWIGDGNNNNENFSIVLAEEENTITIMMSNGNLAAAITE